LSRTGIGFQTTSIGRAGVIHDVQQKMAPADFFARVEKKAAADNFCIWLKSLKLQMKTRLSALGIAFAS